LFLRNQVGQFSKEEWIDQAGVYLLVGSAAEETLYVGEADPIGVRIKQHAANREGWDWGVFFVDRLNKIGKTEVQFLEHRLVELARGANRAVLLNKNAPTAPTMSLASRALAQAFLDDIRLIVPLLGITAFSEIKRQEAANSRQPTLSTEPPEGEFFDTVVVPAREDGFQRRFLGENCWFAIRINARHISKIKYIAAYRVAPIGAVTHIAEVKSIEPYENTGKYMLRFKAAATEIPPIQRGAVNVQSTRYTTRTKVLAAKTLNDIWDK
jgi:hypothetical protein